ncbi:F-box protein [Acorus gramineus]|uniref:F-box protein n=1 Tax=Acorus gramineus TaxID=55184 RepID=A0AAV9AJC0_ACOGR|nr:F-box protein [Acorus gramineus]
MTTPFNSSSTLISYPVIESLPMDALPDAVVQYILSHMKDSKDVARCSCVSRRWREFMPLVRSLYFPRSSHYDARHTNRDQAIGRLICSTSLLEELILHCPFSSPNLAPWLMSTGRSLRQLDLRVDGERQTDLGCIGAAHGLESLKLWGAAMGGSPDWAMFPRLTSLEIVGSTLKDGALAGCLEACPNLIELALLGCDGMQSVSIELQWLEKCRLDLLGPDDCSLYLRSPKLEVLDIVGFGWVCVNPTHCLKSLSIAKNSGSVYEVEFGELANLEFLTLRGVQWRWAAVKFILQRASNVKHLFMKIEFSGDFAKLQPFPHVGLVEFFNSHPYLRSFEIHGAMFAALCLKKSLISVDSEFKIPYLEEVRITVRSPLNVEQKMNTLESLLKSSPMLRKMLIKILHMNTHDNENTFFEKVCRFARENKNIVQLE